MTPSDVEERRSDWKAGLLERLHDPLQVRIALTAIILVVAYTAVYTPLSGQITEMTRQLEQDQQRLALARTIEQLEKQYGLFEKRIPKNADTKDWVQYFLDGIREFPVKMTTLDCQPPKDAGPYKAVVLRIELQGTFVDLDKFLRWLESNPRLIRVDGLRLLPPRGDGGDMTMQLVVLGLTG